MYEKQQCYPLNHHIWCQRVSIKTFFFLDPNEEAQRYVSANCFLDILDQGCTDI